MTAIVDQESLDLFKGFTFVRGICRFERVMNSLAQQALANEDGSSALRHQFQQLLDLDDLNFGYFFSLYKKKMTPRLREELVLHDVGSKAQPGQTVAYSTATAPRPLMSYLPHVQYRELVSSPKKYGDEAKHVVLWVKKMQAGTGSSMARMSYVADQLGISESEVRLGAKGLDLFVESHSADGLGQPKKCHWQRYRFFQLVLDFKRGEYGGVVFHDIVGPETKDPVLALWGRPCYCDPSKTYAQLVDSTEGLGRSGLPTSHMFLQPIRMEN